MSPEDLLAHADFVRSIARSLVVDAHEADDVEQKTWLTVLEHPPQGGLSLRAWFYKVVRNFVITSHRRETRRKKHELESASQEPARATSPDEIAFRKETIRNLTSAVLNLEEPYLSVIILRFYEDMPARLVAERLGVPLETVKTRIQRGLKKLRSQLDETHGGHRKEWILALAPLAGLKLTSASAAAAAVSTAAGAFSSSTPAFVALAKLKYAFALLLLVGFSIGLYELLPETSDQEPRSSSPVANYEHANAATPLQDDSSKEGNSASQKVLSGQEERISVDPSETFLTGQVTDKITGEPITAFDFSLEVWKQNREPLRIHETVYDDEGRFSFSVEGGGTCHLLIKSSRYRWKEYSKLKIPEKTGVQDLKVELDPGLTLHGRVLEEGTDRPVPGAIVGSAMHPLDIDLVLLSLLGYEESFVHSRTDSKGRFVLKGLHSREKRIAAVHPDFAESQAWINSGEEGELVLRMKSGYRIFGRALDDNGNPAKNVVVQIFGKNLPLRLAVLTGEGGRYRTPPLRPGRVFLTAGQKPWELKDPPDFLVERKRIDLADEDREVNFGPSKEHLTWRGTLFDVDNLPKSAFLNIIPAALSIETARHVNHVQTVRCDREGRFEAKKLIPGRYRVTIQSYREPSLEWGILTFPNPGIVEKDINLGRSTSLSGTVVDQLTGMPVNERKGYVRAWKSAGPRKMYMADLDSEGCFVFHCLTPGSYTLRANVNGIYSQRLIGIKVEPHGKVEGVQLSLMSRGRLKIRMEGFEDAARERFSLSLARDASEVKHDIGTYRIGKDGCLEESYLLQGGRWIAGISFEKLGYVERKFEILPDGVTDLAILRNEIALFDGLIAVSGSVFHPDGKPVRGVTLHFTGRNVPNLSEEDRALEIVCDEEGRYGIEGLKPGQWKVSMELKTGAQVDFPELWIPNDSPNALIHNLTLREGVVSGNLFDGISGRPLGESNPRPWKVYLQNVEEDRYIGSFEDRGERNFFRIDGVSKGEYQLLIEAEGFAYYQSGAFTVEERQIKAFSEVYLEPCGVLDLEVVDPSFQPIEKFILSCDGVRKFYQRTPEGKRRYDKLPLGDVSITVGARGYLEKSLPIYLEPGRAAEAQVVLFPEQ